MKSFRSEIERLLPSIRQVARALVESHRADVADDLVHEALDEALRNERIWSSEDLEVRFYARVFAANRLRLRGEVAERRTLPGGSGRAEALPPRPSPPSEHNPGHGLASLPLGDREALLLVVLGRVDYIRAADILGIPASTLVARLSHARDSLGTTLWSGPQAAAKPAVRPTHLRLVKS